MHPPSIHRPYPSIHPSSNMANTSFVLCTFRGMLILKNASGWGVSPPLPWLLCCQPKEVKRAGKKRQRTHNILYFSHARDHVQGRILYLVSVSVSGGSLPHTLGLSSSFSRSYIRSCTWRIKLLNGFLNILGINEKELNFMKINSG